MAEPDDIAVITAKVKIRNLYLVIMFLRVVNMSNKLKNNSVNDKIIQSN